MMTIRRQETERKGYIFFIDLILTSEYILFIDSKFNSSVYSCNSSRIFFLSDTRFIFYRPLESVVGLRRSSILLPSIRKGIWLPDSNGRRLVYVSWTTSNLLARLMFWFELQMMYFATNHCPVRVDYQLKHTPVSRAFKQVSFLMCSMDDWASELPLNCVHAFAVAI